jgi:hypothetical protein
MKRLIILLLFAAGMIPCAFAQETEHVEVGAFVDYFGLSQTSTNFTGVGGRVAFLAYRELKFEGEMSYDFNQTFTENFSDGSGTVTTQRSDIRLLHGMVGPRLNVGRHRIQPFLTAKGGFINARFDAGPANASGFTSQVNNLRANNVIATFYPGGGVEGHIGPVGLRFDVGDEMYFSGGTHHNLRMAFGPFIRF